MIKDQVKTKGKYIILYPDMMGYKKNGYEVNTEIKSYGELTSNLMEKGWYKNNLDIQDKFDEHWLELKGKFND